MYGPCFTQPDLHCAHRIFAELEFHFPHVEHTAPVDAHRRRDRECREREVPLWERW